MTLKKSQSSDPEADTLVLGLAGSRLGFASFGDPFDSNRNILIYVFLRGGMDGLSLVPPIGGPDRGHYQAARPVLRIPTSGDDSSIDLNGQFGLHPSAASLFPLFEEGKLALIQGAGLKVNTRSHFDAMDFIESGTPGLKSRSGWLTRHLQSSPSLPSEILAPSIAMGNLKPRSLRGSIESMVMDGTRGFDLDIGSYRWKSARRVTLRNLYAGGSGSIHSAGLQALNAVDIIETYVTEDYTPTPGVEYPRSSFSTQLQALAQIIKLDVGLSIATVDLGGWDTHAEQGNRINQHFGRLVRTLSEALAAFYQDLNDSETSPRINRLTVVVQSEFGRRLRENASRGSDHGHGNVMLVLGGEVNGGIYGNWPGLHTDQLYDGVDLDVTTDYRQVLSEILIRRLQNNRLGAVFPGLQDYTPLGIVQGKDLAPVL